MNKTLCSVSKDIEWCLNSPGLLNPQSTWPKSLINDAWLSKLANSLQALPELEVENITSSNRLGRYVEAMFAYIFENNPAIRLITKNLVLYRAKQSLGEFDYIIHNINKNEYYHIELSCKFYIGYPRAYGYQWVGTNARDHFEDKLERFFNHQLSLLDREESQACLETFKLSREDLLPKGLFKGWLYYPFKDYLNHSLQTEPWLNPAHLKSWWIGEDEIDRIYQHYQNLEWAPLKQHQWLRPQSLNEISELYTPEEFIQYCSNHFKESSRSFMMAGYSDKIEITRGFILEKDMIKSHLLTSI